MRFERPTPSFDITIAIIGGGCTGAAVAAHLAESDLDLQRVKIIVVEPRNDLGRGLAYGTDDPPTGSMCRRRK